MVRRFRVARNPDPDSRLPYLIWLPVEEGLVLKARETWPRASRVFCARDGTPWDEDADLVDDAEVLLCKRRGAAIDLVLARSRLARSQFVFTSVRGRPAIWWQTQKTVRTANPGARIPGGRAAGPLAPRPGGGTRPAAGRAGRPAGVDPGVPGRPPPVARRGAPADGVGVQEPHHQPLGRGGVRRGRRPVWI